MSGSFKELNFQQADGHGNRLLIPRGTQSLAQESAPRRTLRFWSKRTENLFLLLQKQLTGTC